MRGVNTRLTYKDLRYYVYIRRGCQCIWKYIKPFHICYIFQKIKGYESCKCGTKVGIVSSFRREPGHNDYWIPYNA